LKFMCSSTCFGRLPTHHQDHTTALGASGFTVGEKRQTHCLSWSGRSDHDQHSSNRFLPTVLSCIFVSCWLIYLNRMIMHELVNVKFPKYLYNEGSCLLKVYVE
jgi:hypothetical protein